MGFGSGSRQPPAFAVDIAKLVEEERGKAKGEEADEGIEEGSVLFAGVHVGCVVVFRIRFLIYALLLLFLLIWICVSRVHLAGILCCRLLRIG